MKRLSTLVIHNLKKEKGAFFSFGLIILFTAFMLNLALVLYFQVDKAYDRKFDELNTANINFYIPNVQANEELKEAILNVEGVKGLENREAVFTTAVIKDFRETDFSMNTVFYRMNETRTLNEIFVQEETTETYDLPIYIPLYVASFGQFTVGDEIIYEVDGKEYAFQVVGIVEEMQYGNYGMGMMGAYLPKDIYEKFLDGKEQNQVMEYSVLAEENANLEEISDEISELLNEEHIMILASCNSESAKQTRTMVCNLLILILMAFAFVILLVSVFLCKFRIRNEVEEDMINMGVQKALGYTSSMIVATMVLPYILVSAVSSCLGIVVSYGVLPVIAEVLALQSGFVFALEFDTKAFVMVVLLLLVIVFLFTFFAARRIRKIQPIHAIRGNGDGKHVNKNYFPLDETIGNPKLVLVLKQISSSAKQNVLIFLVSFVLMVLVAFAGTLFYNVIIEPDNFMTTLSEEMPELMIQPEAGQEDLLANGLEGETEVVKVLKYMTETVDMENTSITAFVSEDFSKVTNDLCYLGRNPETKDEIALGSAFSERYEVGEKVELRMGELAHTYEIVGFVQSVNFQGEICELTLTGYEELCETEVSSSLYVYLEKGVDVEAFLKELENSYADMIKNSVNNAKMTETSREMFAGLASVIIIAIFVLTILIVLFILYIVMKSLITQRKQEFGIYKAMGYSNTQLIVQLAGSFLPVSGIAVFTSAALGMFYMPIMNQFIFRTVGAMKNNMEVSFMFLMIFALAQITINFTISLCLAMPIRKISAYSLIKE